MTDRGRYNGANFYAFIERQTCLFDLSKQLCTSGESHCNCVGREAFEAALYVGHPRNRKEESNAIVYRWAVQARRQT